MLTPLVVYLSAHAVSLGFGVATVGVFALNFKFARRDADAVCLSTMLLVMWALSNYFVNHGPRPDSMGPLVIMDLIGGLWAWLAWRTHKTRWKWLLVRVFLLALGAHVAFWTYYMALPTWLPGMATWLDMDMSGDGRKAIRNLYVAGLNIANALALACVAWPGGSNAVVVLVRRLFLHPGRRHPVGIAT